MTDFRQDFGRVLRHALLCLDLGPAVVLFALLLHDLAEDPSERKETTGGWARLLFTTNQYAVMMGVTEASIQNYFRALLDSGYAHREARAPYHTLVRIPSLFLSELAATRPEVAAAFQQRFGYDLAKVSYLTDTGERAEDEEFRAFLEDNMERTQKGLYSRQHSLMQEIAAAQQRTDQARQRNREKPKSQRLTGGRKLGKDIPKEYRAQEMVRRMNERIEENLGLIPEPSSKKLLGQMTTLRTRFGGEDALLLIDYITSRSGWQRAQKDLWQLRGELIPTAGRLLQVGPQLLNLVKEAAAPKRSGGAGEARADAEELSF